MMEKRVVLFLILSLAILLGYEYLLKQMGLAPQPPQPDTEQAASTPSARHPESAPTPVAGSEASPAPAGRRAQESPSGQPVDEQPVEVVTDLFRAVLTNRGATIKSWELTKYKTAVSENSPLVQLIHKDGKFPGPLSLRTADAATNKHLTEGLYQVERDFTTLDATHPIGHLTLTYQAPNSALRVVKQLTFHRQSYVVDVSIKTDGVTGPVDVGLGTNFGIIEWGEGLIGLIGPASLVDDTIDKQLPDAELERTGSVRWVALQDKYFLSVLIPTAANTALIKKEGDKLASAGVRFGQSGTAGALSLQLYAGPKEFDTLKALNVGLEDTIDFGWFIFGSWDVVKAVARPLFSVLRFLHDYTHNYGLAIILLTVGIKLLFVPLQYKSYKSMKEMQMVQPKVLALQQKYKDDKDRLNRELIKLYRDHKVNPVGGCLPMLLQMPVFVALFNILYMTIDLRQAPLYLWITDLSVQDPYYVLPIIMGATMVVQQKITPTTMDPVQAKIMLLMPAFLTLLFLTFPAGLVLYWLTNNVLTIAQQYVTDRYIYKQPTFSSPAQPADTSDDGQKQGGKKVKDKAAQQVGSDKQADT